MVRTYALLTALLLGGCTRIPVAVDFQPGTNFSELSRYYWQAPVETVQPVSIYNSELVAARIEQAVESQLLGHGLRPTEQRDSADLLVSYSIVVEDRVEIDPVFAMEGSYSKHRGGMGVGLLQTRSTDYQQSRLVLDLRDAASGKLLWRGQAERRLPAFDSPDKHAAFIAETVAAILAKYPPER